MDDQSPVLMEIPERLDGPRVRLRPMRKEYVHAIWEAIEESRERLKPWMAWASDDLTFDNTRSFVIRAQAEWLLRESLQMLIFEREGGRLLGSAGIPRLDWTLRSFEIGYWLRTSAEGRGFAQEAVQILTRLAFETLGANRVEIHVDPRNTRSCNVAQRLAFLLEGTLRNSAPDGYGRLSDRHVFALTPGDYQQLEWVDSPVS